ncbi:MAG: hypothetical protein PHI37_00280 [Candidatus Gracilibacteria bacterium]|nr:hypothetical protein [Candidatus Gracilibacteria bacterium]
MKEKIKNIVKNKYFRIIIKFFIGFLLLLILSFILVAIYSFTFEKDKIAIDRYNFEQLEKAKPILESIPETDGRFYSLKEFNQKYNADIKSIKNCYYVINYNGDEKYIFGFKIESLIYIYIYRTKLFAYPKYDLPFDPMYYSGGPGDRIKNDFIETISNPCRD